MKESMDERINKLRNIEREIVVASLDAQIKHSNYQNLFIAACMQGEAKKIDQAIMVCVENYRACLDAVASFYAKAHKVLKE